MSLENKFLPLCRAEMEARGWGQPDFIFVSGDAYVDHPSFGVAIISRVLEAAGFTVAILAQPDYKSCEPFKEYGRPRLGFLVSSGNIDSMVAHYSVAKRRRNYDYYSPGGKAGLRPDRAVIVYCNRIREAYGDIPIILGGLEASLRRFAHYDYWDNKVRRSILVDSRADILAYGMGETTILRIAEILKKGAPIKRIHDVRGTVFLCQRDDTIHFPAAQTYDYDILKTDKAGYARAFDFQYKNQDAISGIAVTEYYGDKMLVQNPPMPSLEREGLDEVYALPYARDYHPSYSAAGGIPAISEVKFSITHTRGCFGACNFCALAFHQGKTVRSRSSKSVLEEAKIIAAMPDFKGYIHDVGGPTANFRHPSCDKQQEHGVCTHRKCLSPKPCPHLKADHSEYMQLLSDIEALPGIKKVFIRSGIRFDYLLQDKNDRFFKQLVARHVSGQLKVAPEHCAPNVLNAMGKPDISVYEQFRDQFFRYSDACAKEQYLVPYLMSSHPGSTLDDAVSLALWLKESGYSPEQVQDFYPTPGTVSTVMYYTGINPLNGKEIHVCTDYREKRMQRALLQYNRRENASLIREALTLCGREDLIGYDKNCLVRPEQSPPTGSKKSNQKKKTGPKIERKPREKNNPPKQRSARSTVKNTKGKTVGKSAASGRKRTNRPSI